MARLSTAAFVIWTSAALAAPLGAAHAELKIGVVNVQRLMQEAPQVKELSQSLENEFAPRQREMIALDKDLKTKADKLQRDGAVMAENERRSFEKDLRDGQRDLARKSEEFQQDVNQRRNEELTKVQRTLLQEVQTFAKTANYDLVVGDGVLFRNESLDVTAQILSALQQHFKPGAATATKPAASPAKPAAPPAKP